MQWFSIGTVEDYLAKKKKKERKIYKQTWIAWIFIDHVHKKLTLLFNFSRRNGLNRVNTMLNTYGWFTICKFFTLNGTASWSRSTIFLANGGVNCQVCWRVRPSMSKMTTPPAICVLGSSMAASRYSTHPLKISSRLHLLCFHFLPSSSINTRRPCWSRMGSTVKTLWSNTFFSLLGFKLS